MSARDPAAARWGAIQLTRLIGVASVLLGIVVIAGRTETLTWMPDWVGYLLIASGLIDMVLIPVLLARRWRTPPP